MEFILEMPILINLPFEYDQRLFIKQPIDFLTNNIIERLKVSSIEKSVGNLQCVSNQRELAYGE